MSDELEEELRLWKNGDPLFRKRDADCELASVPTAVPHVDSDQTPAQVEAAGSANAAAPSESAHAMASPRVVGGKKRDLKQALAVATRSRRW